MKKLLLPLVFALPGILSAQKVAIKNNLAGDAALSPNLSVEVGLSHKTTLDIYGAVNPFNMKDNKSFKHWLAQPELRLWTCERFNGPFFGAHLHTGSFLMKNIDMPFGLADELEDHRYEGYFYGGGVSFGYQWVLGDRWNLELSAGVGYVRTVYDVFDCNECKPEQEKRKSNYFGPTKCTVSFMYFFK